MYKMFDFMCECGSQFEELVQVPSGAVTATVKCPKCGGLAESLFTAPKLATYSLMSPEAKSDHLRARSEAHTAKYCK